MKSRKAYVTFALVSEVILALALFVAASGRASSAPIHKIVSINAGSDYTCAVLSDGMVKCWGSPLGLRRSYTKKAGPILPLTIVGISKATAVATGSSHACAPLLDGTIKCWGDNSFGEMGNGTKGEYRSPPVNVSNVTDVASISSGSGYTCAVLSNHTIKCWGAAPAGSSTTPVPVSGLSGVVSIAAGQRHACALLSDGTVTCWGSNLFGQLGTGGTARFLPPQWHFRCYRRRRGWEGSHLHAASRSKLEMLG
jgi:alpha-tubulin suppressor-like RCC1 family protein